MKCLVSGATGFIGRQLCRQLVARGDTVIALSKHGLPLGEDFSTVAVDLTAVDPDASLFKDVEVVFHLAGIAHQRAADSAYAALNYDATIRLARLASAAGVSCFIFLSSVKAMGAPDSMVARSENACTRPLDAYGLSKWRAENALRDEFSCGPMAVVIIRPALVYGAEVKGNLRQLAQAVRFGLPRPPLGGKRSMIALQDLVELLFHIADAPPLGLRTWIACGAHSYSTQSIYDLLRSASGKGRGLGWLPHWVWKMGTLVMDVAARRPGNPSYEKLFGTELYSNASLLAETDWQPRVQLQDVIDKIASPHGSGR